MRAVIQRSKKASVTSNNLVLGKISSGLVVLLGIQAKDGAKEIQWLADKIINLRIFEDESGKMNRSLAEINKEMLIVSQFTLYGDCRKGRRPGFSAAAPPDIAEPLYEQFISYVKKSRIEVATGTFGAEMQVQLVNDGPVTMLLDTDKNF